MAFLTKNEILAQLKKLGVISDHELKTYCREYEEYSSLKDNPAFSTGKYPDSPENQ